MTATVSSQVDVINRTATSDRRRYYDLKANAIYNLGQAGQHLAWAIDAIREIHDRNLWKLDTDQFSTWADYCTSIFGLTRQRIWQLLQADETKNLLISHDDAGSSVNLVYREAVANLTETAISHLYTLDPELQPLATTIAIKVAEGQGVKVSGPIMQGAVDAVNQMVITGSLEASIAAHEYQLTNIERHSKWTPLRTLHNPDRTQIDDLKSYVVASRIENLSIKIVVYIEKDEATK